MCLKNTTSSYGAVAKFFHWAMALLIIGLLALGLYMADLENTPDKFRFFRWHKEFGILVLMLAAMRLGWKVLDVSPLLPASMSRAAKMAARAGHGLLYMLMFAMPLTGWVMSSAAGFPVSFFGLFVMPDLVSVNKDFSHDMAEVHENLAWILMGVLALHVVAALLHHFYYRDNILKRMLPFSKRTGYVDSDVNTGC